MFTTKNSILDLPLYQQLAFVASFQSLFLLAGEARLKSSFLLAYRHTYPYVGIENTVIHDDLLNSSFTSACTDIVKSNLSFFERFLQKFHLTFFQQFPQSNSIHFHFQVF